MSTVLPMSANEVIVCNACVGVCVGVYLRDEADEFVEIGALNGIFVLGRSMGFIGTAVYTTQHGCVTHYIVNILSSVTK